MKQRRFQFSRLNDHLKQMITKNFWLKILALILAIATYVALYDNTVKNEDENKNADITSNLPVFLKNDNRHAAVETTQHEPKQDKLTKPKKETDRLK